MAENMSTATQNSKGADVFDSFTHRHAFIWTQSWNALGLFQVFKANEVLATQPRVWLKHQEAVWLFSATLLKYPFYLQHIISTV